MQILSLYFREIQNVECVLIDSFIILLLLRLLATKYLDEKKAGDFNRGESLNSPHTGYGPGAHQMEPPSLLISGVNPFPSRFINRTIFFVMRLLPAVISRFSLALSSISARNLPRESFYL